MRRPSALAALTAAACVAVQFWSILTPAAPAVAAATGFQSLAAPQRVLDTRPTGVTADGQHQGVGGVAAETRYQLPLAGRVGLPAELAAVVLNVTVTDPAGAGFVTVYPCRDTPPTASNLNYVAGQTVPNAVMTAVGDGGAVCLFTKAPTHLVVDVAGWFPEGAYQALDQPARLYESRPGRPTVDMLQAGEGVRPAEAVTRVKVHGRAGLGTPPSVVLNVTASETQGPGFVNVFPCGPAGATDRPNASNLNYAPGQTVPNLVVAKVGTDGEVCVFTKAAAHLIVDVAGALPGATYVPLASPQRLLDSRPGSATADGQFQGFGAQPAGASLQLDVTRAGIPTDASAVVLNVTAVGPLGAGYLSIHPRGSARPTASNVNHAPGATIANAVVARVGRGGEVCVFSLAPTDVLVDVAGYLTGPPPPTTGGACPATTAGQPGAAEQLVRRPALHRAVGQDLVAILVCDTPDDFPALDPAAVAAWANDTVSPWFAEASRGAFTVVFESVGRIAANGIGDCVNQSTALAAAPFTNVIAVPEVAYGGGQAGPGYIWPEGVRDTSVLELPPSESSRGGFVGGGAAHVNPSVFVHEVGHTVHWPHSFIEPGDEYTNPVDVMSGEPDFDFDSEAMCDVPGSPGAKTPCWAQHTLAFNRVAAGWVADQQIAIHPSGRANYALDAPAGDGVQLVALPDRAEPLRIMTIEARPAAGRDQFNEVAGVAVHLVDQTGDGFYQGVSTERRQAQATGASYSYDHVVPVGGELTVHGVTVRVYGEAGAGYSLELSGSYRSPGALARDLPVIITQSNGTGPILRRID
jgi:hypothetical protein